MKQKLLTLGLVVVATLLVACGGGSVDVNIGTDTDATATTAPAASTARPTAPTEAPEPARTPQPTAAPTATARPIPTATATAKPEPTMTLEEYAATCKEVTVEIEEGSTYGELSAVLGVATGLMGMLTPPQEVAEWHALTLELTLAFKGIVDTQDEDKQIGMEFFAIAASLEGMEAAITAVEAGLSEDTRKVLVEHECMEGEQEQAAATATPAPATLAPEPRPTMPPFSTPAPETLSVPTAVVPGGTPTPQAPGASTPSDGPLGLQDFAVQCPFGVWMGDFMVYGDFAEALVQYADALAALSPPPQEIADWHAEAVAYAYALADIASAEPAERAVGDEYWILTEGLIAQEDTIARLVDEMDPMARSLMFASGCISP